MKEIQSVYIDTTFCVPQAMFIPSRDDTTNAAVSLIDDWLSRSHGSHIVHLQYRADLGYENLFVRFSLEFNMKVGFLSFIHKLLVPILLVLSCLSSSLLLTHLCYHRTMALINRCLPEFLHILFTKRYIFT